MRPLPIDPLLPDVVAALGRGTRLVLRAPPGAGKTTRVPAALLDAGLAADGQVVVLEPRRIAARAAAEFVVAERAGRLGEEVGYRVRFESRGGAGTRLWFVTEGVFSRQLLGNPYLDGVGAVVLDEFHERHLQGDVALGIVRELQETVRPDLKVLVMSATLDTERIAAALGDCPVVTSEGRAFPVTIEYDEERSEARLSTRVANALRRVLAAADDVGDVLVFLPGAAEIRRAAEAIGGLAAEHDLAVVPMHGDLTLDAQRAALRSGGKRKVVLSTNVAETALTIEGVTTVIDSGLAREARFEPRLGIDRLREVPVSRAAAEQRAGRAGRLRPGRCLRLWTRGAHAERREREVPEVLRLDLSATVLELRAWGVREVASFPWLDRPTDAALAVAESLLETLGAIEIASGAVTALGRRMLEVSAPPRHARLLLEAERLGVAGDGALLAALASERDIRLERRAFGRQGAGRWPTGSSDLLLCRELFLEASKRGPTREACLAAGLDFGSVMAVERSRRQLARAIGAASAGEARSDPELLLRAVLAGYPDRVSKRRAAGSTRARMVGGSGVALDPESVVRESEFFVAVELEAGAHAVSADARVRVASAIEPEWLAEAFPAAVRDAEETLFDEGGARVVRRATKLYLDLPLEESVRPEVDPEIAAPILAAAARRDPERALSLGDADEALLARIAFLARVAPELGLPADRGRLLDALISAVAPGSRSFADLRRGDFAAAIRAMLGAEQRRALESEAPSFFRLPSGRQAGIRYQSGRPPIVAARIQELFGLSTTPRLARGRAALAIEILAPSRRPVQVTDDLASFWARTYPEVRKQLRGRYPKHAWPESPATAVPASPGRGKRSG